MSQSRRPRAALKAVAVGLSAALVGLGFATPALADDIVVAKATAQAVNINLLSGTVAVAISENGTVATNTGHQSNDPVTGAPDISVLPGESFLTAGALAEIAEANGNGSSYACAGVVAPGGSVELGTNGSTCTPTGNGTGGVTVDLGKIPQLSAVSALADIQIHFDALVAHANEVTPDADGNGSATGGAILANPTVSLAAIGGALTLGPLAVTLDGAPNEDLLPAVLTSLTGAESPLNQVVLGPILNALSNAIENIISIKVNYQHVIDAPVPEVQPLAAGDNDPPLTDGQSFQVSALHVSLLDDSGATADIASVTVGPNVAGAPLVSSEELPIVIGGAGIIAMLALGVWAFRRRRVAVPSATA